MLISSVLMQEKLLPAQGFACPEILPKRHKRRQIMQKMYSLDNIIYINTNTSFRFVYLKNKL